MLKGTSLYRVVPFIICTSCLEITKEVFMHASRKQMKSEKGALRISLWSGAVFVLVELVMSIFTSSQAILLDAVYDAVELVMILVSLTLVPLLYKPASEKHPFGFQQMESLFVVVKGAIMVAVTLGLVVNNIEILLHGGRNIDFVMVAYFEVFSCFFSILILGLLIHLNKKMNSPTVTMEIQEWKIDIISSLGMTFAFLLPRFVRTPWMVDFAPYLDQVITIVLCFFMLPTPIKAVIEGLRDLFLMPPDDETIEQIKSIVTPILESNGYDELSYDIVKTGRKLWISVYITFDRDDISISRFRHFQTLIIKRLSESFQDFYFELLPDIEYCGRTEVDLPNQD